MALAPPGNVSRETDNPHDDIDDETGQHLPYAWITVYPAATNATNAANETHHEAHPGARARPPEIAIRTLHASGRLLEFEIACLLAYWHHEHDRINDPDAPAGTILLPRDPGVTALLHQYAIALLCLPKACPASWTCHCNEIRARFNAPPPDHEQPTATFSVEDLREASQKRRNTEPGFPYRDPNAWTHEDEQ